MPMSTTASQHPVHIFCDNTSSSLCSLILLPQLLCFSKYQRARYCSIFTSELLIVLPSADPYFETTNHLIAGHINILSGFAQNFFF